MKSKEGVEVPQVPQHTFFGTYLPCKSVGDTKIRFFKGGAEK